MIRTIDPTACDEALPVIGAEPIAEIIRAHRISLYSDRWDALRRTWAGRGRERARNTVETVIVDVATPAEAPKGVCSFPGCGYPIARNRLCEGHRAQKRRRGSGAALTPMRRRDESGRASDTDKCRKCTDVAWRRLPSGKRYCVTCARKKAREQWNRRVAP